MRTFRILALVLIGVGLLLQDPAYAAARPPAPAASSAHCADMAATADVPSQKHEKGCCDDMQTGCVFGMNCMAPLIAPDLTDGAAPALSGDSLYSMIAGPELAATARGPEPPPPQPRS